MDNKIQNLTDKLYREGVEKGDARAKELIQEAEERADWIIKEAKKKAKDIIADSRKSGDELKARVEAEIRLAERQAMRTFKKEIEDVIVAEALDKELDAAMNEPLNIEDFVAELIRHWHPEHTDSPSLELLLPEKRKDELEAWFRSKAGRALSEGIDVKFHENIKGGFQIASIDGGYRINLTDEDFNEFFKQYLRPRTRKLLFGEK